MGPSGPWTVLGLDREVAVFTKAALDGVTQALAEATAAAAGGSEADPPDEFFDLTPEDFARIANSGDTRKKVGPAGFLGCCPAPLSLARRLRRRRAC